MTEETLNKFQRQAFEFLIDYSTKNGLGTQFDFDKIPFRIHEKSDEVLVVIESPENDVFFAPLDIIYCDKAFITIINDEVQTTNPFSASAPMYYYEGPDYHPVKKGLYPGSIFFNKELNQIKNSFIDSNIEIGLTKLIGLECVIKNQDLIDLTSNGGIFYMASHRVVCILIYKNIELGEGLREKSYRIEIQFNLESGDVIEVEARDITPPPALC